MTRRETLIYHCKYIPNGEKLLPLWLAELDRIENKTKRETMSFEQEQAERDTNVKKLFTLSVSEKLTIAAVVFLWAALLNSPAMNTNLAYGFFNQSTDCKVHAIFGATPKMCEVTGPEIRSAN